MKSLSLFTCVSYLELPIVYNRPFGCLIRYFCTGWSLNLFMLMTQCTPLLAIHRIDPITQSAKDMGPTTPRMRFYMGPIRAPHMGLGWDLQHGSMWYPHGQTHMGQNGNHMGAILDLAQDAHVQPTFVE